MNRYHFDPIKHIHSLEGKPLMGTSTVVGVLNKPLGYWTAEQTLKPLGWQKYNKKVKGRIEIVPDKERIVNVRIIHNAIRNMRPQRFLDLLDSCYKAHTKKLNESADAGTERHKLLEIWIKICLDNLGGRPIAPLSDEFKDKPELVKFVTWAQNNVKRFLWSELYGYSKKLWTGGIADVGWESIDNKIIAGDFKSSKEVFLSQYIQIGGYHLMLEENGGYTAEGEKIFILDRKVDGYMVIPFGMEDFEHELVVFKEVEALKEAFKSCVHLHSLTEQFKQLKKQNIGTTKAVKASSPKLLPLSELLAE